MDKRREIKSLSSYLFVGGCAAVAEWISFFLFNQFFSLHFSIATTLAFLIATYINFLLGKEITFKNYRRDERELLSVFFISGLGLLFNLLLMFLFVDIWNIYSLFSKILATGIVFFWNYIARRVFIYKNEE